MCAGHCSQVEPLPSHSPLSQPHPRDHDPKVAFSLLVSVWPVETESWELSPSSVST
jgi:hypothetical protein